MKFIKGLLDNIKSKGRHGDTELRIVNNEVSHVNKDEANLIDNYGLLGQVITQKVGSGTTNPSTGLLEYYFGDSDSDEQVAGIQDFLASIPHRGAFEEQHTGADLNKFNIMGQDIDFSISEMAKYINPETNELIDPVGLIRHVRKMNPSLKINQPDFDDNELIQWFRRMAPQMFASQGELGDVRDEFTSDALTATDKARKQRLGMDFSEGRSGITRFGDTKKSISEGLYKNIAGLESDKYAGIQGLRDDALASQAEFIYGLTDPESSFYTMDLGAEEFDQSSPYYIPKEEGVN